MKDLIFDSLNLITNGIVITDPSKEDNPVLYVNKAFTDITGYSESEVIGKNCRFLQGEDKDDPELNKLRDALKKRKPVNVILKNYRKNKTTFWNELYISPVKNKGKTYFIGIQQNVTERIQNEQELKKYKEKLELLVEQRTKGLIDANKQLMNEIESNKENRKKIIILNEKLMNYAKQLERRIIQKEEKLTKNEQIILSLLKEHPELNLNEIAKKSKIPISTISVARKRLLAKHVNKIFFPSFSLFNLITLVIFREESKEFPPEAFFGAIGKESGFYIMLNKNWQEFNKTIQKMNLKNPEITHFDISESSIQMHNKIKKTDIKLKQAQLKILYGICKYDDIKKVSERTEISLQTALKHKKTLLEKGVLNSMYYEKLDKFRNLTIHRDTGSFININGNQTNIGISFSKDWNELEKDAIYSIPINDAKLKIDFSGAIKKNFLEINTIN